MLIKGKEVHKKYICMIMAVVLVISAVFVGDITSRAAYKMGTVYGLNGTSTLNFREGPGTEYKAIAWLSNGQTGEILEEKKATTGTVWYKMNVGGTVAWASSAYIRVTEYSEDDDFEVYLAKQGFPESYKEALRKLHAKYPNWKFEAQHTGLTWKEMIDAQNVFGRSLVSKSSISSWKSIENGAYNWETSTWVPLDGGAWVAASKELIQYYVDPRNFLDDQYVFQFLKQSYDSNVDYTPGVTAMFSKSKFWSSSFEENGTTKNYITAVLEAGAKAGVSPYTIASTVIQEQGWEPTSALVSGASGHYNFFNVGAFEENGMQPDERGIWYAKQTDPNTLRPWNTRTKSLTGGAMHYGKNYIGVGQDTLYLKKFDVIPHGGLYNHQYMTHIRAAANEGKLLSDAFWSANASESTRTSSLVFKIPVYIDMPATASPRPTGDGSPNYMLKSLSVSGQNLTPTFNMYETAYSMIVPYGVSSLSVSAKAYDSGAKIAITGTDKLIVGKNKVDVKVTAGNGSVRTYTISVVRQEAPANIPVPTITSSSYSMNTSSKIITKVKPSTSAADFLKGFSVSNGTVKLVKADGSAQTGLVGTGNEIHVYDNADQLKHSYQILIYGDTDGDGKVYTLDYVRIKKSILSQLKLDGIYKTAADTSRNGQIDTLDYVQVKKQILGQYNISQ